MAPIPSAVGCLLRQVIYYHLDNCAFENALFFAERLAAQDSRSNEANFLYALCHLRLADFSSAYDVSRPSGFRGVSLGCAWIFAQACLALERYKDGIVALEKTRDQWLQKCSIGKHSATMRANMPDVANILCLLGKLHRGSGDNKKAVSCFEEALKKNPLIWDAFTALCDMGIDVRVPNIFKANAFLLHIFEQPFPSAAIDAKDDVSSSAPDHYHQYHKTAVKSVKKDLDLDPFNASFTAADIPASMPDMPMDPGGDALTKLQNSSLKLGAAASHHSTFVGLETPTIGSSGSETSLPRTAHVLGTPQAPLRKPQNYSATEDIVESIPRMSYRLGSKKSMRTEERGEEAQSETFSDASACNPIVVRRSSALPATDRKRTLSGQPILRSYKLDEPTMRRSARLNMFKPSTTKAKVGSTAGPEWKETGPQVSRIVRLGSSGSSVGRIVSGNRKPLENYRQPDTRFVEVESAKQASSSLDWLKVAAGPPEVTRAIGDAVRWILDMMKKYGHGYYFLSRYQGLEALQALSALPLSHQGTSWVLAQIGRAHYEQASYAEAEKIFKRMRMQAPSRLQDMEVYSTVLWHLKRETELSFLAHELVNAAWLSPQAWCVMGNAWSLARDAEQALKCFKRAAQLDPTFAYAFSLQGHEYVTNEEYEKALTAYRQAIAVDSRHYHAYYGIGRVQERLGAYDKAYSHFHAAQMISPNNAVLVCCMGTALEKQKKLVAALSAYTRAVELAPCAAQTRYKKARAFLMMGQMDAAKKELMILKDLAPEEATVHFLLGTLYKKTHERQLSVRNFTMALSLDPKAAPEIKGAIVCHEEDTAMEDSILA